MDKINQIHMKLYFGVDTKEPKPVSKEPKKKSIFTTTIHGVVSDLRTSVDSNQDGTAQIATFKVNNTPVEMRARSSIGVFDGDYVVVSGGRRLGLLRCYAFKNLDTGSVQFSTSILGIYLIVIPLIGIYTLVNCVLMFEILNSHDHKFLIPTLLFSIVGCVVTGFLLVNLIQRIASIFNVSRFQN